MSISKRQRKELARHKAIAKARNIRTNNLKSNPSWQFVKSRTYRLWCI